MRAKDTTANGDDWFLYDAVTKECVLTPEAEPIIFESKDKAVLFQSEHFPRLQRFEPTQVGSLHKH